MRKHGRDSDEFSFWHVESIGPLGYLIKDPIGRWIHKTETWANAKA